jgi:hypothetical protein
MYQLDECSETDAVTIVPGLLVIGNTRLKTAAAYPDYPGFLGLPDCVPERVCRICMGVPPTSPKIPHSEVF